MAAAVATSIVLSAAGMNGGTVAPPPAPVERSCRSVSTTTAPMLDDYEFLEASVGVIGRVATTGC